MFFSSIHLVKYFVEKSPIWFFFKKITWILVHIFVVNDDASVVHIIANDGASLKTGSLYCECNICVCDVMLFMKGYGRMEVSLNWFLTLAIDQGEWLATFCILGKSPQYQSNIEAAWITELVCTLWRRKKISCFCQQLNHDFFWLYDL